MISIAIGGPAVVATSVATYFAPHALRLLQECMLRQRCVRTRSLVLTYDDGPCSELIPQLLDLLARRGVQATFFLLGFRTAANTEIADRIIAEGHETGCHTHWHLNAWKSWPWKALKDIEDGYTTLSPWVSRNGLFRPPWGKLTIATWLALLRRGAPIGWWTIDSGDTRAAWPTSDPGKSRAALPAAQRVVDAVARHGGGVVLMHDHVCAPHRQQFVLQTTALLLDHAEREGLTVRRLGDLMRLSS